MWIILVAIGAVSAVLTALLNGYTGFSWLLIAPLFLGYTAAALILSFVFAFIVTAPIDINKPVKKPSAFYGFLYNLFNDFLCSLAGIKIEITGGELLSEDQTYLFVYNHRSNFDPMLISKYFKRYKVLMVSKPQNFKKPLAGKCIHKVGFMAIDRENDREAIKTIVKAADYLKQGYSVAISPEGTRNKNGTDLLPFRNGSFKIATKAKAPICVMCFNGTEKISKNFPLKRTVVTLDVLKVINAEDYQGLTTAEIGEKVRFIMSDNISKRNRSDV